MDIIGVGHPCIDIVSVVDRLPTPNKGSAIREFSRQGGGVVPTAIVAAARLGAKTGFIGVAGGCIHGGAIVDDFKYHGVDVSRLIVDSKEASDFAIILSDLETAGRSIMYHKGTTRSLNVEDLDREYIQSARFLHLAHFSDVDIAAAQWIRQAGGTVVYDASMVDDRVYKMLPLVDVFIASEFFYRGMFSSGSYEDNCRQLMGKGPRVVVVTLGKEGCVGVSKDGYFEVPAYNTPVVDTLGAGDVFHGAYIVGLLKGMNAQGAARFANAVSSIKVTAIGGRAGIPDFEMVTEFMRTGSIDKSKINERVLHYRNKWLSGSSCI
jgi:sugar/nucleoside kinase (ribokinase family)